MEGPCVKRLSCQPGLGRGGRDLGTERLVRPQLCPSEAESPWTRLLWASDSWPVKGRHARAPRGAAGWGPSLSR